MTKRKKPAAPAAPVVDANNDGHDDNNGQFVAGNQAAADPAPEAPVAPVAPVEPEAPEVTELVDVETNLIAAAEAFLAAAVAFAEVPTTPRFFVGEGYRLTFAGNQLYSLYTA